MPIRLLMALLAIVLNGCVTTHRHDEPTFEVTKARHNRVEAAVYAIADGNIENDVVNAVQLTVEIAPVDDACLHGATFRILRRGCDGPALRLCEARVDVEPLFGNDERRYRLVAFLDEETINGEDIIVECNSNGDRVFVVFRPICPNRYEIWKMSGYKRRHFRLDNEFWVRQLRCPRIVDADEELELLVAASDGNSLP